MIVLVSGFQSLVSFGELLARVSYCWCLSLKALRLSFIIGLNTAVELAGTFHAMHEFFFFSEVFTFK